MGVMLLMNLRGWADELKSHPYQAISERNVFGLNPLSDSPSPPAKPPPNCNYTLTGIAVLAGEKLACFETTAGAGKPPHLYCLSEGERDGEMKVVQVNYSAGSVQICHEGTMVTLSFETHGRRN